MENSPQVSVVIPVRAVNSYLRQTLMELGRLFGGNPDLEVLVFPDAVVSDADAREFFGVKFIPTGPIGPSEKRNLALRHARGEIFAFLDDDSFPRDADWLRVSLELFRNGYHDSRLEVAPEDLAGVCGPTLTPANDGFLQKVTGLVYWSYLGSAGSGTYRNRVLPPQLTADYQSANLMVRRRDLEAVGGFDVEHWPGEDTKLCMDLTAKLGKKILYHPKILVFHHRRPAVVPHLKQISRYAMRSGNFARLFPESRWQLGFLAPAIFVWGLVLGLVASFFSPVLRSIYLFSVGLYTLALILTALDIFFRSYEAKRVGLVPRLGLALLTPVVIFLTHVLYGVLFQWGFAQEQLGVTLHKVDKQSGEYRGG